MPVGDKIYIAELLHYVITLVNVDSGLLSSILVLLTRYSNIIIVAMLSLYCYTTHGMLFDTAPLISDRCFFIQKL